MFSVDVKHHVYGEIASAKTDAVKTKQKKKKSEWIGKVDIMIRSGRNMRGYILTYSELLKGEHLSALGSQQAVLVGGW